jgi:hypothetical protein
MAWMVFSELVTDSNLSKKNRLSTYLLTVPVFSSCIESISWHTHINRLIACAYVYLNACRRSKLAQYSLYLLDNEVCFVGTR